MTREEAIYRLKNIAWLYGSAEREQNIEAIDMAIEALLVETKGDLISRQWLLDLYATPKDKDNVEWKVPLEVVRQNILDAPSAEAVPLSVVDKISEECERLEDRVAELEEQLADTVSREPLDIFARMYRAERESARGGDAETDCSTCKHKDKDWDSEECDSCCVNNNHYEPVEAVQGEWIKTVDGNGWNEWYVFKCPLCGATIEDKQYRSWEYNFCPNCGAHMRGEVK